MKRPSTLVPSSRVLWFCCLMALGFASRPAFSQTTPTPSIPTPVPRPTQAPTPPPTPGPTAAPTPVPNCTQYTAGPITAGSIVTGANPSSFSLTYNQTQSISLPFAFTLYDETFSQANISPEGNLQFISSQVNNNFNFSTACIPISGFDHTIFALHDPNEYNNAIITTSVSGQEPNLVFNIEYQTYFYGFTPTPDNIYNDFEIRLYEGQNRFDLVYGALEYGYYYGGYYGVIGVQKNQTCYTAYACPYGQISTGVTSNSQLSFTVPDTIAPTVFIANPSSNATVTSLTQISGQADDNAGGSGVTGVSVALRRNKDGFYWNGASYTSQPATLATALTGDTFTVTSPLPSGANLPNGSYTVAATATDGANNSSSTAVTFTVGTLDVTAPTVTISTPQDFSKFTNFPSISGTAADEAQGSGLATVDLILQRQTDGAYWTGTTWLAAPTLLTTTLNGNNWSRITMLPSGQNLVDSAYQIFAYATDNVGNSSGVAVLINVDRTPPSSVVFTTPTNNTTVNQLNLIQGTAMDAPNGTGIDHVNIFLRRASDATYFNGRTWVTTQTSLPALLSPTPDGGVTFTVRNLPTGSNLRSDRYIISAVAVDKTGNQTSQTISVTYSTVDRTTPTVTFTSPKSGATVTTLTPITGTVADNVGGSGVARVDLTIQRGTDGKYWNGTAFVSSSTPVKLTTALVTRTNPATWSRTANLPTGANLQNGKYALTATGYDKAGNHAAASETVTVKQPVAKTSNEAGAASAIKLSLATAQVATSSLQLRFGGALDAESAGDAAHYAVQVNGHSVSVQSAAYNAITHSVVLDLGTGALRAGDHVTVTWQGVLDAQGQADAGKTATLTAQ